MFVERKWDVLAVFGAALAITACGGDDNDDGDSANAGDGDAAAPALTLEQIGRFESNVFDESAAEIVAHDPASQRLFVVNSDAGQIEVLSIADPTNPVSVGQLDAATEFADSGGINSVASAGGIIGVAVENTDGSQPGVAQFYNAADLAFRGQVAAGVLPDAITFTPDGATALVANEGEPLSDYSVDPEGSVSIVDVSNPDVPVATAVGFADFNADGPRAADLPAGVRIFGNFGRSQRSVTAFNDADPATLTLDDASGIAAADFFTLASTEGDPIPYRVAAIDGSTLTLGSDFDGDSEVADAGADGLTVFLHDGASSVAQDLEPEFIAVAPDGETAFVSLQENNAVAVIDIAAANVSAILDLGVKDHNAEGNALDASNDDDAINIRNWPVNGLYQPDSIAAYTTADGATFFLTANEGDAREYDAFVEEVAISDVGVDTDAFDNAAELEDDAALGSLDTSIALLDQTDTDGDGAFDVLRSYGARSFSIRDATGALVFDSGSDFETIIADALPDNFNSDNDENSFDSRSDDKGPEPEAVTVGVIAERSYAFIGLERVGGIMVYDITDPANAAFASYTNNRDFSIDIEAEIEDGDAGAAGDLGPEGIIFIAAADSPIAEPLLVVGNEVSGTTTLYRVVVE